MVNGLLPEKVYIFEMIIYYVFNKLVLHHFIEFLIINKCVPTYRFPYKNNGRGSNRKNVSVLPNNIARVKQLQPSNSQRWTNEKLLFAMLLKLSL